MSFQLKNGLKESPRSKRYTYDAELLTRTGRYGQALTLLDPLLKRYWKYDPLPEKLQAEAALTLVHECEQAREWAFQQMGGKQDYETARVEHDEGRRLTAIKASKALMELVACDEDSAYDLRMAFSAALCAAVQAPVDVDYVIPDQNRDDGGLRIRMTGEVRRAVEYQFAMRAALGDLDTVLKTACERLELWSKPRPNPWHQVGNLRFSPSLSRKSRASIVKDGNMVLGSAILGLSVALSSWFREWSLHQGLRQRWVGETVLSGGRPSWSLVAEFVNAAFDLTEPETAESVRQRTSVMCKKREVRLMTWSTPPIREAQVQKF